MAGREPVTELDARFSSEGAQPTAWPEARRQLRDAEIYWLSTVRPDGRPHVTPVLAVWLDDALYFCTGTEERKAKNLRHNAHCVLTTGRDSLSNGLDLVMEGSTVRVADDETLVRIADAYQLKYGGAWRFEVRDGAFHSAGGEAYVYEVAPTTGFGFRKGRFGQTRWRFPADG